MRYGLMMGAAGVYVAFVLVAVWLLRLIPADSALRWLVALLPIAGAWLLVGAGMKLLLGGDEMARRAAAIAAIVTVAAFATVTLAWGIFEALAGLPPVNPVWWGAGAMAVWSGIFSVVWNRYQ